MNQPLTIGATLQPPLAHNKCLGSECMAWRQTYDGSSGFCGLSGDPQNITMTQLSLTLLRENLRTASSEKPKEIGDGAKKSSNLFQLATGNARAQMFLAFE